MGSLRWTAIVAVLLAAAPAEAQTYPEKPVKIVVGSVAGGGLDVLARAIAQELSAKWGKPVIVENKPGAAGAISAEVVATAPADGHTLLGLTDQIVLANRFVYKKLPYDPEKSFTSIVLMAKADQLLLAVPAVPATDIKSLVALDKEKPGTLAYGSWGDGSPPQLLFETLNKIADTRFLNVPYKGVAPVLGALSSSEVQLSVISGGTARPLLASGKAKALAIAAKSRAPELPDIPTTAELGYPQLLAFIWFGLSAPTGTARTIVDKINADVVEILKKPAFAERYVASLGWQVVASSPAEMDAVIQGELPLIREMVNNAGVVPQ
jgi:tripartite-type tricarboxylate transporter receptor subunit TctC